MASALWGEVASDSVTTPLTRVSCRAADGVRAEAADSSPGRRPGAMVESSPLVAKACEDRALRSPGYTPAGLVPSLWIEMPPAS